MIQLPDRLLTLMQKVESGQPVTQTDVDRVAVLQAIDLARAGRQFAEQAIQRDEDLAKALQEVS